MNSLRVNTKSLYIVLIFNIGAIFCSGQSPITPFESNPLTTCTYEECISFYKKLTTRSKFVKIVESGASDIDEPIHTVIISTSNVKNYEDCKKQNKLIILINNGIHPGEPDGIDASMIFARDMIVDPQWRKYLDRICIVIIPVYNIGGMKQRNSHTRANQNGPLEYGFRGNVQNLDLNRDFIKMDSRNAVSFVTIFQKWKPHIFIDTHTTDGADYPYTMTLISSQKNKLNPSIASCMYDQFVPELYAQMKKQKDEMFPYVDFEGLPNHGIYDFEDSPRYSSGYAALHHCLSFVTESHMLKPHRDRVNSQLRLLKTFVSTADLYKNKILESIETSKQFEIKKREYALRWTLDKSIADSLDFNAYEVEYPISPFLHKPYLFYNKNKVSSLRIPYYNYFVSQQTTTKPKFYIIHQAYYQVIDRLKKNNIPMTQLHSDSFINAQYYKIIDFQSPKKAYENHFLHSKVTVEKITHSKKYFKGDYIIPMGYESDRFVIEVLEPQAKDSYFAWNFFDAITDRKEYFSDYIFTHQIGKIFEEQPQLFSEFQEKMKTDSSFKENVNAQLYFIYTNSKFSEPNFSIYPVARVE